MAVQLNVFRRIVTAKGFPALAGATTPPNPVTIFQPPDLGADAKEMVALEAALENALEAG